MDQFGRTRSNPAARTPAHCWASPGGLHFGAAQDLSGYGRLEYVDALHGHTRLAAPLTLAPNLGYCGQLPHVDRSFHQRLFAGKRLPEQAPPSPSTATTGAVTIGQPEAVGAAGGTGQAYG